MATLPITGNASMATTFDQAFQARQAINLCVSLLTKLSLKLTQAQNTLNSLNNLNITAAIAQTNDTISALNAEITDQQTQQSTNQATVDAWNSANPANTV